MTRLRAGLFVMSLPSVGIAEEWSVMPSKRAWNDNLLNFHALMGMR